MQLATTALLLAGTAFVLVAAFGVLRLPDVLMRMHAATKAGTLGIGLILAAALLQGDISIAWRALVTFAFLLVTTPVSAHLIGRAAHRTSVRLWRGLQVDELAERTESRPPDTTGPGI